MRTIFEKAYEEHYEKLYTLAFRVTGNREDAEDALHTAFLNAYKAFENFREESAVATWLYRIVLNACQKYLRQSRKMPVDEYADAHHLSRTDVYAYIRQFGKVEDEVLTNVVRETCLQMFMNCMPAKYRAVYTLRVMLDFSVQETAEILDLSESHVKVNLHRAKRIIKDHVAGRCSLIRPGAPCDCRSYAKFLRETGQIGALLDIHTVRRKEQAAADAFDREMGEILDIEDLYTIHVIPPLDYEEFLGRVKMMRQEKNLKILEYE